MKHFTVLHKILSVFLLGLIVTTTLHAQDTLRINMATVSTAYTIPATETRPCLIYGTTTTGTITIQSGFKGTIVLRKLSITSSKSSTTYGISGVSCITVEGAYNRDNMDPITKVDVILDGANTLTYTPRYSGCAFQVNQGAQIHINAVNPNNNASGTLIAKNNGEGSAAIGAPYFPTGTRVSNNPVWYENTGQGTSTITQSASSSTAPNRNTTAGGNIIIGSGTVTANAYQHGAGIGGGWYTYYNGVIIVYGGIVTAQSNYHAAGMGSGCPQGTGVLQNFANNSTIIALPPAEISAKGTTGNSSSPNALYGLNGAQNITYMNDPGKPHIVVKTEYEEPGANIYLDLTETPGLQDIFDDLEIKYDLSKVRIGRTNAAGTDLEKELHGRFEQETTFFTDASSSNPDYLGRPFMPVKKKVLAAETIELPLLKMKISFTDYPSKPLKEGYNTTQARQNAHVIKMEYNDPEKMNALNFRLQGGGVHFENMIFLKSDSSTVTTAPTELKQGDKYYIILPIKLHKTIGIYSDVLLIGGKWGTVDLPGYIRRIGMQKVVKDDTGRNDYIKVTASPTDFVATPSTAGNVTLTLNIDHKDTGILYDKDEVTAKYLVTTESDYNKVVLANPDIKTWTNMQVPAANGQNQTTTVPFAGKPTGIYYIHWYVESGVVYAHTPSTGFGPYIIADALKAGTITGNPSVCAGQIPGTIKGEVSTGGSGSYTYKWEMSTNNGTTWDTVGGNTADYTPTAPLTVSPTLFRRTTTDTYGSTATSNTFSIRIVADGITLYWKKNTTDKNWNNPANWVDANGTALNMVPVSCSNVFIPSGANNYPSLDINSTPVDVCGAPVCNNITFAYGAELAYQHILTYNTAKIQYNFGYYGTLAAGQPANSKDGASGTVMLRERWYLLSAPLKQIASGDFSFGGYPFTWQALDDAFSKENNTHSLNFKKSNPENNVSLSTTNNAIAVKAATYNSTDIGYKTQNHLESLQGVLEIPYFENTNEKAYHPTHGYDPIAQISSFYYFNNKTLQLVHNPVGRMKRNADAYRFIFEGSIQNLNVGGTGIPCYVMKVKANADGYALIGNPFMASINMSNLYSANPGKFKTNLFYRYNNDNTWPAYTFGGHGVNSQQAFVVQLTSGGEQELIFPMEGTLGLTGKTVTNIPRRLPQTGALGVNISSSNGLNGDFAELLSANTSITENVDKLLIVDDQNVPEVFFIGTNNKSHNLMQVYKEGENEVGLGIVSKSKSGEELTLVFDQIQDFVSQTNLYPVLIDKHLGVKQNLSLNNIYGFTQRKISSDNNYIDADRFAVQLLSSGDEFLKQGTNISIGYINKELKVKAIQKITQIQIYDTLGRRIYSEVNINTDHYAKTVSLNQGVYLVKVCTENGESKVEKIMAL